MVPIVDLWLPILLSAVFVFVLSSIIHMMLKYHASDFKALPDEEKVMDALRPFNIPPGDYWFPRPANMADCKAPEYVKKITEGPVAMITVCPNGPMKMGASMAQWFIYCIIVSIFAAYIAGRALPQGGSYLEVFRFAGATAFIGYGLALIQNSIWYKRSWSVTFKSLFDSLLYGLVTAGTFGWLWPKM